MNKADAIIYTNKIIADMEADNAFNPDEDVFFEKEYVYNEILKFSEQNLVDFDDPAITESQLVQAIETAREVCVAETVQGMVGKGILNMSGMDENGDFIYTVNGEIKKTLGENLSK